MVLSPMQIPRLPSAREGPFSALLPDTKKGSTRHTHLLMGSAMDEGKPMREGRSPVRGMAKGCDCNIRPAVAFNLMDFNRRKGMHFHFQNTP